MEAIDHNETDPDLIWKACHAIAATDPEKFARVARGELSLRLPTSVPLVEEIVSFYKRVTPQNISMMPGDRVHAFSQEICNVQIAFEEIMDMQYQDPDEARDRLRQVYHSTRTELTPFVPADTVAMAGSKNEMRNAIGVANEARKETERIRDKANSVLTEVQKTAADVGVTEYMKVFDEAATTHRKQKKWWLGALGLLSIVGRDRRFLVDWNPATATGRHRPWPSSADDGREAVCFRHLELQHPVDREGVSRGGTQSDCQ